MSLSLDDQIKKATLDKLLLEARKVEAERLKVELDTQVARMENNKAWWQRGKFWQQFFSIFIGIGVLGFYIAYVVVPTASINNLKLERDNERKETRLFEKEKLLKEDSLKYVQLLKYNDSLKNSLEIQQHDISTLVKVRDSLFVAIKDLLKSKNENSSTLNLQLAKVNSLLKDYKTKEELVKPVNQKVQCFFSINLDNPQPSIDISKFNVSIRVTPVGKIGFPQQFTYREHQPIELNAGYYNVDVQITSGTSPNFLYRFTVLTSVITVENVTSQTIPVIVHFNS